MAKYIIVGDSETNELWLVDVENGKVEPLTDADLNGANAVDAELAQIVKNARNQGLTVTRGVNIAISSSNRTEGATQSHIGDPD